MLLVEGGVRDRECYPCPPGSYSDVLDAADCKQCPVGKFQPGTGMDLTNCMECGAGTYQDETGQTECKYCADSQTSEIGSTECIACAAGRFMSSTEIAYVRRQSGWCKDPFHTFCFDPLIPKYSGQTWRNVPSDDKDFSDIIETCPLIKDLPKLVLDNRAKTRDILQADACANACRAYPGFIVHHAPGAASDGRCYCTVKVHPNCDVEGVEENIAGEWVTYAMGTADGAQPGCVECPAGKYSGVSDLLCDDCPDRHFSLAGSDSCTPWTENCPLGEEGLIYPTNKNDLVCHECRPGFFRDTNDTADSRDEFKLQDSNKVTQTNPSTLLPNGDFGDTSVRFKLINEKTVINTCVFETSNMARDQELSICPSLSDYTLSQPADIFFCPEGTHVYYSGERCCRNAADAFGNPITFGSLSCLDDNYELCPNENRCSYRSTEFADTDGICVAISHMRHKYQCGGTEWPIIADRNAESMEDCAYLCAKKLKNNELGSYNGNDLISQALPVRHRLCYCQTFQNKIHVQYSTLIFRFLIRRGSADEFCYTGRAYNTPLLQKLNTPTQMS